MLGLNPFPGVGMPAAPRIIGQLVDLWHVTARSITFFERVPPHEAPALDDSLLCKRIKLFIVIASKQRKY